ARYADPDKIRARQGGNQLVRFPDKRSFTFVDEVCEAVGAASLFVLTPRHLLPTTGNSEAAPELRTLLHQRPAAAVPVIPLRVVLVVGRRELERDGLAVERVLVVPLAVAIRIELRAVDRRLAGTLIEVELPRGVRLGVLDLALRRRLGPPR